MIVLMSLDFRGSLSVPTTLPNTDTAFSGAAGAVNFLESPCFQQSEVHKDFLLA